MTGKYSPVQLARDTVEEYVVNNRKPEVPSALEPELRKKAAAFVTLKKEGELRGCIGTTTPRQDSLAREIIENAISACSRDPRFPPVSEDELPQLEYSVDVLQEPEKVEDRDQLDPDRYGVIVEKSYRRGLLLPDLEGVDTVEQQLNIASRKAGISPGEEIDIYRFRVKRYEE